MLVLLTMNDTGFLHELKNMTNTYILMTHDWSLIKITKILLRKKSKQTNKHIFYFYWNE